MQSIAQDIQQWATTHYLPFGISPMALPQEIASKLSSFPQPPFAPAPIEERLSPKALHWGKSVLVFLFPYYQKSEPSNVSQYAQCLDYHHVVSSYLKEVEERLIRHVPTAKMAIQVDSTPLWERYMAWRAGLGVIGKNHCLIHPTYGSYCFIGSIVTDLDLPTSTPLSGSCMNCHACLRTCPGSCLGEKEDFRLCRSYLTQKKGDLAETEAAVLRQSPLIFGCDSCQTCCPHNRHIPNTPIPEFQSPRKGYITKEELESLSNREFSLYYKPFSLGWRGKKVLLRNLLILE